jgi:hypothetical protein
MKRTSTMIIEEETEEALEVTEVALEMDPWLESHIY